MKFLVLGSSGMAGHVISLYLKEKGHEVTGFSRRSIPFVDTIQGDATDTVLLEKTIKSLDVDVIINAIGILNQKAEERKDLAVFLNSYLPHFVASITQTTHTRIIHMSTDCVFRGGTGPYKEDSFPDGITFYDRTKALGELNDNKNLTIRCSIVGPDINEKGIGLFNWFMKQSGTIRGYTKALWTGLTTIELARSMLFAAEHGATGLVNLVPSRNISKYELLFLFNRYFRKNSVSIVPDESFNSDKTLVRTNFAMPLVNKDYEEQVKDMRDWVSSHVSIYPNYREVFNDE